MRDGHNSISRELQQRFSIFQKEKERASDSQFGNQFSPENKHLKQKKPHSLLL
jgi:hypothetical protein